MVASPLNPLQGVCRASATSARRPCDFTTSCPMHELRKPDCARGQRDLRRSAQRIGTDLRDLCTRQQEASAPLPKLCTRLQAATAQLGTLESVELTSATAKTSVAPKPTKHREPNVTRGGAVSSRLLMAAWAEAPVLLRVGDGRGRTHANHQPPRQALALLAVCLGCLGDALALHCLLEED